MSASAEQAATAPTLAELTTLRVGGPVAELVDVSTEADMTEAIAAADGAHRPLLVLGGGSNILAADAGFDGVVIRDRRREIVAVDSSDCAGVTVRVSAGMPWDDVVTRAVMEEWSGIEALAGIPGSTGATPVQNVGAYGQEVGETIAQVRAWDRAASRVVNLAVSDLDLSYRNSILKRSLATGPYAGGATGRWVVLDVTFQWTAQPLSAPVRYAELANRLDIDVDQRAPLSYVREAVLEIRGSKGMLLNPTDHDTWSAGSFFTNPILAPDQAATLPADAPRFPVFDPVGPGEPEPDESKVKTSAAWLISHAGFTKGWGSGAAALSTKHVLALTNRGGASAQDIAELARTVRDAVRDAFGVTLVPEPVVLGLSI